MVIFNKYARVPTSSSTPLPSSISDTHGRPKTTGTGFGRARTRWALIFTALIALFFFLTLASSDGGAASRRPYSSRPKSWKEKAGQYAGKLKSAGSWSWWSSSHGYNSVKDVDGVEFNRWLNGSGRTNLKYDDPFNPEDLTLTEDECDTFFPGLWYELERSAEYFTEHTPLTKEYLDRVCDDGIWSHARVLIHQNEVYLKYFQQSAFTRINSALGLLYKAVVSSREKLPEAEFCLSVNDWGSMGKFSLDRHTTLVDVWLMPDYAFHSWPEPEIYSYTEAREKALKVEKEYPWEKKIPKLMWRGSLGVGTADRQAMLAAAKGYEWNDLVPLDWSDRKEFVTMEDHCKWKFHAFPEGITYSGRLRYLQNCRSVIITHQPRWIQHWTHMYNADPESEDQNIIFVPEYTGEDPGPEVSDMQGNTFRDRTWMRLPEVMDELLKDDKKAKRIADNQWSFFRERYVSPASAACYWRKAIKIYSQTMNFTTQFTGTETSYETFVLLGNRLKGIAEP